MVKTICILIISFGALIGQSESMHLKNEIGYSIIEVKGKKDTILSYEIEFDSLNRKLSVKNHPIHDANGIVRINEFRYKGFIRNSK